MTTEQQVLEDLEQSIQNTNRSNDDFLKVLKLSDTQDVSLRDGTAVPSLAKRVKQASLVGSEYNVKSENLADVPDKMVARTNLSVYSKEEVDVVTQQATEVVKGQAKIATTTIAQAGVNDTDFLTAKKLREGLNASGDAPISACRAWICFNGVTGTILDSFNIKSLTKNGTGNYTVTFTTPMSHNNYAFLVGGISQTNGVPMTLTLPVGANNIPLLKTTEGVQVYLKSANNNAAYDATDLSFGVFC